MEKDALFLPKAKRDPDEYIKFSNSDMRWIFHPTVGKTHDTWPESSKEDCMHCEEGFTGPPIPIPMSYDPISGKIETMPGVCCGGPCLKGYLVEHTQFNTPLRLAITCRMLVDVFGIDEWCGIAPPRSSLKKHGGPYTAADFRGTPRKQITLARVPPFSPLPILYETVGDPDTRAQQAPALFQDEEEEDQKEVIPEITVYPPPLPTAPPPPPPSTAPPPSTPPPSPAAQSAFPLPPKVPRKRAPRKPKNPPPPLPGQPRKLNPLESIIRKT